MGQIVSLTNLRGTPFKRVHHETTECHKTPGGFWQVGRWQRLGGNPIYDEDPWGRVQAQAFLPTGFLLDPDGLWRQTGILYVLPIASRESAPTKNNLFALVSIRPQTLTSDKTHLTSAIYVFESHAWVEDAPRILNDLAISSGWSSDGPRAARAFDLNEALSGGVAKIIHGENLDSHGDVLAFAAGVFSVVSSRDREIASLSAGYDTVHDGAHVQIVRSAPDASLMRAMTASSNLFEDVVVNQAKIGGFNRFSRNQAPALDRNGSMRGASYFNPSTKSIVVQELRRSEIIAPSCIAKFASDPIIRALLPLVLADEVGLAKKLELSILIASSIEEDQDIALRRLAGKLLQTPHASKLIARYRANPSQLLKGALYTVLESEGDMDAAVKLRVVGALSRWIGRTVPVQQQSTLMATLHHHRSRVGPYIKHVREELSARV